ncbi:hypothetical protein V6Z11_A12G158000 [Gossypium hirsutum]|uniref:Uncharacterized protein LOC107937594 n=1 Tax=Gossypium hirsutum TaxID=3635 RepID=A0A1U8MGL9_GOSHI|nr:uncharacterized protein LOC107937594 [Gossypium hirsutum]XP_016725991.1 uncharacterized protein LOC107937594 [Gossypium hirsutum]
MGTIRSRKVEEVTFEQYVRFDQSLGQDEIKNSLKEHIGSCGEISRVAIPVDWATGGVKGYAYLDFNDGDSFNEALELDGSELNKFSLTVNETKPKGESRDGPGSGRGGGGRGGRRGVADLVVVQVVEDVEHLISQILVLLAQERRLLSMMRIKEVGLDYSRVPFTLACLPASVEVEVIVLVGYNCCYLFTILAFLLHFVVLIIINIIILPFFSLVSKC